MPLPEGGQRKKDRKKSIIKPFSTISVPSKKIQGGHGPPLPPTADAHALRIKCTNAKD